MGSFGERMQREREMRDISLEEIAESTKISCRMLRALEEEDFSKLPGGIFNKGFVRAYSKFLGIDEEQAVSDFMTAFQESLSKNGGNGTSNDPLFPNSEVISSLEARSDRFTSSGPDQAAGFLRAAVILVFVLGVGGFGWKYFSNKTATANAPGPKQSALTLAPVQKQERPGKTEPVQSAAADPSQSSVSDSPSNSKKSDNPGNQTPTKPTGDQSKLGGSPTTENRYEPPDAVFTGGPAGPFSLQILAKEQSWVEVTADGKRLLNMTLSPGSEKSFRASKEIVVRLGNAPGVELSYNGKQMALLPSDAKIRTLTFTTEGMRQ